MSHVLLAAGGINNWVPLILPLIGVLVLAWLADQFVKFAKRQRLLRENQLIEEVYRPHDELLDVDWRRPERMN